MLSTCSLVWLHLPPAEGSRHYRVMETVRVLTHPWSITLQQQMSVDLEEGHRALIQSQNPETAEAGSPPFINLQRTSPHRCSQENP